MKEEIYKLVLLDQQRQPHTLLLEPGLPFFGVLNALMSVARRKPA